MRRARARYSTPVALDKERDYPRRYLTAYDQRHPKEDAIAISTKWQLESEELKYVESLIGKGGLRSNQITIYRQYNQSPRWILDVDDQKAIAGLAVGRDFNDAQIESLKSSVTPAELGTKIGNIPDVSDKQRKYAERLKVHQTVGSLVLSLVKYYFPTFMYFSSYDRMDGAVRLEHLQQWKVNKQIEKEENSGARLFMEFLEYAGVPLDDILKVGTYETFNAKLQAASNNITDQILEYWTQNPDLSVEVTIDPARPKDTPPLNEGTIGRARIYNALHRVDTPFSERSAGFVWFFSFLVKFAQVKADGSPAILLLDEPGLTLHGKAQGDLLRYFDEKLAPYHQIIYTTHSPFMVAADKLTSARVVEDQVEMKGPRRVPIGTKVREDVLSRDPDTIFPLQGALGYELTQTLFIGKHTLLVEGTSDIVYLQALSHALKARKRIHLDERWTLCPSGGIGNVRAFVSLFGGNKLDVAVLADQTKTDVKKIEELRRSEILKSGRVWTISDFTGKPESDIEDLFEPQLFVSIVNSAFALPSDKKLTPKALEEADESTGRLVKKAEAAFRLLPDTFPVYDHFTPAAWLIANLGVLEKDSKSVTETLERSEKLFAELNKAL